MCLIYLNNNERIHVAIQLFVPTFDVEECLQEIRECLEKGWTGMGYKTVEFEQAWKEYTGHSNALFLNSATAGLHLAVEILREENGWNSDDEIITTPLTFVSTNHAIIQGGMKAIFADVNESLCLDPHDVISKITPKTKAVMFVGIGGNAGTLIEIAQICKENNLCLILDAAHMAGTQLNGETAGLSFADVTVYSFQAVKNLPTSDSGMLCFKDKCLDEIARKKSWLGINKDTYARTSSEKGAYKWEYNVEYTGYKYNGNTIAAAIGLVQLRRLEADNDYRRHIASLYEAQLEDLQAYIEVVKMADGCISSRHLFQVTTNQRDALMMHLKSKDIYLGVHYTDNTRYHMYSYAAGTCPRAARYSDELISLPIHLRLSDSEVSFVCQSIREFFNGEVAP